METIQLNGKEYINKDDVEKYYIDKIDLERDYILKNSVENPNVDKMVVNLTDENSIMGMGSVKLTGDWKTVKIDISYLETAIKALKLISYKEKRATITVAVAPNYPLCLGDIKESNFSGIIIAPRVDND